MSGLFIAQNRHVVGTTEIGFNYTVIRKIEPKVLQTSLGPVIKTVEKVIQGKFPTPYEAKQALEEERNTL